MGRTRNSKNKITYIIPAPAFPYSAEDARSANIIGEKLANARKRLNLKQNDVLTLLEGMGISVQQATLSAWEKGVSVPNAYILIALCSALHIEDGLEYFCGQRVENPVRLNQAGLRLLKSFEEFLVSTGAYKPYQRVGNHTPRKYYNMIEMPVSDLGACAGTGLELSDESMTMMEFPEQSVPDDADFGIYVRGDSMEPVYKDGELVWVKQTYDLNEGDVGIFIVDSEGFIKMLHVEEPDDDDMPSIPVLVSFNDNYDDIEIHPEQNFRIVGKVLS